MSTNTDIQPIHPHIADIDRQIHYYLNPRNVVRGRLNQWRGQDYGPAAGSRVRITMDDGDVCVYRFDGHVVTANARFSSTVPTCAVAEFVASLIKVTAS